MHIPADIRRHEAAHAVCAEHYGWRVISVEDRLCRFNLPTDDRYSSSRDQFYTEYGVITCAGSAGQDKYLSEVQQYDPCGIQYNAGCDERDMRVAREFVSSHWRSIEYVARLLEKRGALTGNELRAALAHVPISL
jgi:hypothetical protein